MRSGNVYMPGKTTAIAIENEYHSRRQNIGRGSASPAVFPEEGIPLALKRAAPWRHCCIVGAESALYPVSRKVAV
jgi:hypothetical protein